ncbi:MAG: hypothetical protein EOP83_14305 [Verrucomicrobiaceae bacterium]|nr:MAG: hypothetical protein EOP83_14305 [Verrucomicrobiaceae bacterium]
MSSGYTRRSSFNTEGLVYGFLTLIVVVGIAFLGWAVYDDITSEKYEIRKDEFTCTRSHQEVIMTTQTIGNTTYQVPQVSTVCDQYTRNSVINN